MFTPPKPLTTVDLGEIERIRPQEWPEYRATFEHYFSTSCCRPFGVKHEGRLVAMGTLIQFERSAWIAQLVTAPEHRRQGLANSLLKFLLGLARDSGVQTVSLVATAQGQPLYARAGFRTEGEYGFFHRSGPALAPREPLGLVLPWTNSDISAMAELERQATGENRQQYWQDRQEGSWTVRDDTGVSGFWLPQVGEGLVIAASQSAGEALLRRRVQASDRIVVPLENPLAVACLVAQGFREVRRARRMVLGPSLVRKPLWQWSRIGGNLG